MKLYSVFLFGLLCATTAQASELKSDERVQFYPSTAALQSDQQLQLRVQAWVYELEERPGAQWLLSKYLNIDEDKLGVRERARYSSRTQLFRFDSERNKQLRIQLGNQAINLPRSNSDGRVSFNITLKHAGLLAKPASHTQRLSFNCTQPNRSFFCGGYSLFVPNKGLSIVSDIDDTIKDSNVLNKQELLLNTFVREFKPVQGMAKKYQLLLTRSPSTAFHYVSGSPHQLHPALADFLSVQNFPEGSMHLRDINLSKEVFGNHGGTREHKLSVIRQLIKDFPQRQFVLIGDSGELDPEIYATIASEFPEKVQAIWIRDVTQQKRSDARYVKIFARIPAERWHLFTDSASIQIDTALSNQNETGK